MSTGLAVFDTTVQHANEWLKDIEGLLPPCDRQQAYGALRAVSHALRDHLPVEGALSLSAELPMLLRGMFLEGWRPHIAQPPRRDPDQFVADVAKLLPPGFPRQPNEAAVAVFEVIFERIGPTEARKVAGFLPEPMRVFWPAVARAV